MVLTTSFNIIANERVTFEESSWEDIAELLRKGDNGEVDIYDYIHPGEVRRVNLAAMNAAYTDESHVAQQVEFVIVAKNVVDLASGGKCHFVLQQKNGLANGTTPETGYMHGTKQFIGWRDFQRRQWCNEIYYNALPSELKSLIKTVKIKSSNGAATPGLVETEDRVFYPCEYNVTGTTTYSGITGEDDVQWDYYKTQQNRIKKIGNDSGVAQFWYTRSVKKDTTTNTSNFSCAINKTGLSSQNSMDSKNNSNYSNSWLVTPAFCI